MGERADRTLSEPYRTLRSGQGWIAWPSLWQPEGLQRWQIQEAVEESLGCPVPKSTIGNDLAKPAFERIGRDRYCLREERASAETVTTVSKPSEWYV